ncbi:MAG: HEPN domain-containing protein [Bacteroidetes bacterium]|nr:HEPN domain-containing protein [Bacteroidota bacterium]
MVNTTSDLSEYRQLKAKQDLLAAKLLFDNNHYAQSLNRSYYAIFHSVRSLLAFDKFDSKKHSGIISYFINKYVRSGMIDEKFSQMLTKAQRLRLDSDYDDLYVADKETAEKQLIDAKKFISFIKSYIEQNKG